MALGVADPDTFLSDQQDPRSRNIDLRIRTCNTARIPIQNKVLCNEKQQARNVKFWMRTLLFVKHILVKKPDIYYKLKIRT